MAKSDYLAFDAYDIKELMNQRLSEGNVFTDQLFEDSNISALIDVFAYLYDILTYYVNKGASESVFIDSKLYENMNRMVKMLGYNPAGWIPATVDIVVNNGSTADTYVDIPRYTSFNTGISDEFGNSVYYSTVEDYLTQEFDSITGNTNKIKLYNGVWAKYTPSIDSNIAAALTTGASFEAEGIPFEQFILQNLDPDSTTNPIYVGHPHIHIYVERDGEILLNEFTPVSESTLFGSGSSIYGPNDRIYEIRLNDQKRYVITFGDGIHGQKLQYGDKLHIYYLRTFNNGFISANYWDGSSAKPSEIAMQETGEIDWYEDFLSVTLSNPISLKLDSYTFINENAASSAIEPESVDDIKVNAPNWFRTNGRLVTIDDFENFVMTTFKNNVQSVKVMDNWDYLSKFMYWLYQLDELSEESFTITAVNAGNDQFQITENYEDYRQFFIGNTFTISGSSHAGSPSNIDGTYTIADLDYDLIKTTITVAEDVAVDPSITDGTITIATKYLEESRLQSYNYNYADSCDFNNIYIWIKYFNSPLNASSIEQLMLTKKTQTIEPVILESFPKYFIPCVKLTDAVANDYDISNFDPDYDNYIEIRYDNYSKISSAKVKQNVINKIDEYFKVYNNELGQRVNINQLYNDLLTLDGVSDIYTVWAPISGDTRDYTNAVFYNGLSFATWTAKLVEGSDIELIDSSIKLKDFQFPELSEYTDLSDRVEIVFESHQLPQIEY